MESIVCTHLDMCLEELIAIKTGKSLIIRLQENREVPCLSISCVNSHSSFYCSFLVEDILTENQNFLSYTEKKLLLDQMLLSLKAIQSAAKKFYEYLGDIHNASSGSIMKEPSMTDFHVPPNNPIEQA